MMIRVSDSDNYRSGRNCRDRVRDKDRINRDENFVRKQNIHLLSVRQVKTFTEEKAKLLPKN